MEEALTQRLPRLRDLRVMPNRRGASRVSARPFKVTPYATPNQQPPPADDFGGPAW